MTRVSSLGEILSVPLIVDGFSAYCDGPRKKKTMWASVRPCTWQGACLPFNVGRQDETVDDGMGEER